MEVVVLEIDKDNRRISLGHKQLEENPWDVFETLFAEDSVHQGTIIDIKDKTAIVSLPYGVEGVCPAKHMRKEDGESAKIDETLDFKIIEFNKDAKKIVVSHTATFENIETAKPSTRKKTTKGGKENDTSKAVKSINQKQEKSTLGDLDALAQLKDQMDSGK